METTNSVSMQQKYQEYEDNNIEEEWVVKINTGAEYLLGKYQALLLKQAIGSGQRGVIMFETFAISIPYITEFYRKRRYKVGQNQLPAQASEKPFVPVSRERMEEIKKKVYANIKKIPGK